jgi:hypothetical protein
VDLYWDNARRGYASARFGVQEVAVTVAFEQMESDSPWRVGFTAERGEPTQVVLSAFEIFNGVMQAVQEFLDIRQPDAIVLVRIEQLGYVVEGPVRAEPYAEFTLRRTRPSAWRS